MLANERDTLKLCPSKPIIVINWFSGAQAGTIVAEHKNECTCIKETIYLS